MSKHKVFLSHYHLDDDAVKEFTDYFCDKHDVFIPKVVGDDYDTTINSDNQDYIMRKIREDYLTDSTVTIVLIGDKTYGRKYVDWEIASTLRNDQYNKRSGLIGIFLPGNNSSNTEIPPRLQDNINCGYAKLYGYPSYDPDKLTKWIDEAFDKKDDEKFLIDNSRALFKNNRS